jgi:hypothetical protein
LVGQGEAVAWMGAVRRGAGGEGWAAMLARAAAVRSWEGPNCREGPHGAYSQLVALSLVTSSRNIPLTWHGAAPALSVLLRLALPRPLRPDAPHLRRHYFSGICVSIDKASCLPLAVPLSPRALSVPPAPSMQDNNLGLVRQVVSSLAVRSIQRLTQTFLTLSLADIASNAGLASADDAEARILRCGMHTDRGWRLGRGSGQEAGVGLKSGAATGESVSEPGRAWRGWAGLADARMWPRRGAAAGDGGL